MSITREELSAAFSDPKVVYCSRMAPTRAWPQGQVVYCHLPAGHHGDHEYSPKWIKVEKKDASKKP